MLCAKIQVPTLCDIPENSKCTSYELATIFQVSCLLPSYTIRCTLFQGNLLFRSRDSLLYSSNVFGRQRLIRIHYCLVPSPFQGTAHLPYVIYLFWCYREGLHFVQQFLGAYSTRYGVINNQHSLLMYWVLTSQLDHKIQSFGKSLNFFIVLGF